MVYSFRLCLTKDPQNRVPLPAGGLRPGLAGRRCGRYFAWEERPILLWTFTSAAKCRRQQRHRQAVFDGARRRRQRGCQADPAKRREIWEASQAVHAGTVSPLTTDEAVPASPRKQLAEYGLCGRRVSRSTTTGSPASTAAKRAGRRLKRRVHPLAKGRRWNRRRSPMQSRSRRFLIDFARLPPHRRRRHGRKRRKPPFPVPRAARHAAWLSLPCAAALPDLEGGRMHESARAGRPLGHASWRTVRSASSRSWHAPAELPASRQAQRWWPSRRRRWLKPYETLASNAC